MQFYLVGKDLKKTDKSNTIWVDGRGKPIWLYESLAAPNDIRQAEIRMVGEGGRKGNRAFGGETHVTCHGEVAAHLKTKQVKRQRDKQAKRRQGSIKLQLNK